MEVLGRSRVSMALQQISFDLAEQDSQISQLEAQVGQLTAAGQASTDEKGGGDECKGKICKEEDTVRGLKRQSPEEVAVRKKKSDKKGKKKRKKKADKKGKEKKKSGRDQKRLKAQHSIVSKTSSGTVNAILKFCKTHGDPDRPITGPGSRGRCPDFERNSDVSCNFYIFCATCRRYQPKSQYYSRHNPCDFTHACLESHDEGIHAARMASDVAIFEQAESVDDDSSDDEDAPDGTRVLEVSEEKLREQRVFLLLFEDDRRRWVSEEGAKLGVQRWPGLVEALDAWNNRKRSNRAVNVVPDDIDFSPSHSALSRSDAGTQSKNVAKAERISTSADRTCSDCGVDETPAWRRVEDSWYCNACGVRKRKQQNGKDAVAGGATKQMKDDRTSALEIDQVGPNARKLGDLDLFAWKQADVLLLRHPGPSVIRGKVFLVDEGDLNHVLVKNKDNDGVGWQSVSDLYLDE